MAGSTTATEPAVAIILTSRSRGNKNGGANALHSIFADTEQEVTLPHFSGRRARERGPEP